VTFYYGPTNTFKIGNPLSCPSSPSIVTTVFLLGASSVTDPSVINLAQLLMTLDTKINPNALTMPVPLPADYDATKVPAFDTDDTNTFNTGLKTAFPNTTTVTTPQEATTQLAASLKTLTVTMVNNGTVTSNPAGISCPGICSFVFQTGQNVTLNAIGNGFQNWSGGCVGSSGTCAVTMNDDTNVTATFAAAPPPATLTISKAGTGTGTVTCSVNGGSFSSCAPSYPNGTPLVLRATPDGGSTFTGWTNGTGNINCTGVTDCSVTLTADSAVTANFTPSITQVSITANTATTTGGGGSVQCSANGGAAGACGSYPVGTAITVIATPNSVSNFTGWTATVCSGTGDCNFTLTANTTVTANFNRPTLSVVLAGTGTGSVSSTPSGINCGATCSAVFDKGTSITLTTSSAGFTGWSGPCSGTGTCGPITLTTDTTVTAMFGQVTSSSRWLFYFDFNGTLKYVDPANPGAATTPISTTVAGGWINNQFTASWDAQKAAYTNITLQNVAYMSGGKIFRVSALKSQGVPGSVNNPPVQVSSESAANEICHIGSIGGAQLSTVKLIYLLAGQGGCTNRATSVMKMVGILDDPNTPPTVIGTGVDWSQLINQGLEWVTDLSTGAPTHMFLIDFVNNNTLKLLNLSNNTITPIQANIGQVVAVEIVIQDTSDRIFLRGSSLSGGGGLTGLYLYTISTNQLVPLVTTTTSSLVPGNPLGDGTNFYFAEGSTGKLYKVPMTATGPNDVVVLSNGVGFPLGDPCGGDTVVTTTNDVFIHTYVPGVNGGCGATGDAAGLYRIAKSNGAATPIVAHATGTAILRPQSSGALLYYGVNHNQGGTSIPQAKIINENGTSVFSSPANCFPCSGWAASINSPTFFVRTGELPLSKVILGTFVAPNDGTWNGNTLTAFDAPTGTPGAVLGTVPNLTPAVASVSGGDFIDTSTLLYGDQTTSTNTYLFFVDAVVGNSLAQVSTGPGPWSPVF